MTKTKANLGMAGAIWAIVLVSCGVRARAQEPLPPTRSAADTTHLSDTLRVFVREFRFEGNAVFSSIELAQIVSPFVGRELDTGDLEEARRALTLHYVKTNGYVNSGALLPDQPVNGGVITFQIVEGQLTDIEIQGNERLRTSYLRERISLWAGAPLNLGKLEEGLLILKENPNIQQLNAELKPGVRKGEGRLDVKVTERNPWHAALQTRNDRPPGIGAEVVELLADNQNVTGHSDALELRYGLAHWTQRGWKLSGAENLGASYRAPLHARDTSLQLAYTRSDYAIIEEPFASLDIESESDVYSVALRHPLLRRVNRELSMGLIAERRRSASSLDGEPFSFSAGAVDGEATVAALRFVQEWLDRSQNRVFAFRSTLSWGADLLGSTDNGSDRDGTFLSWLGQLQYVQRVGATDNQFIVRSSFQWTADPLLSLEQISLGGAHSVRGYRENQMVRDLGWISTVEVHIPVWFAQDGSPVLQFAPFVDYGNGWNLDGLGGRPRDLTSVGAGLIFTPNEKLRAELFWGHGFRRFEDQSGNAQDVGIHFRMVLSTF